jgi:hypothetical protein
LKSSANTLLKVFVRAFYLENATFFLFVAGIAGGFMSGIEHVALVQFFISKAYLTGIPSGLWMIYAIRINNFNRSVLARTENGFVFHLILYPRIQQWLIIAIIAVLQFMPAVSYGFFLIVFAAKQKAYLPVFVTVANLTLISFGVAVALTVRLHRPGNEAKIGWFARSWNRLIRPYPAFIIEWVARRHFLVLSAIKFLGSIFLYGVLRLYTSEAYDSRLLNMAIVIATAMGTQLIFEIHQFENNHFAITRQLPISFPKRIINVTISFILISLLETGIIITYFPENLPLISLVAALLFAISCQLFLYGMMYLKVYGQEELMKITFACSILWIALILFKVPVFVLLIVNTALGIYWWVRSYYAYEPIPDKT